MSSKSDNGSPRMTLRVDHVLAEKVSQAAADGPYMDESEFAREALRCHLRRLESDENAGPKQAPKAWRDAT